MIRRHFFLAGALCVLLLMLVAGGVKLAAGRGHPGDSAGGAPAAGAKPAGGAPQPQGGGSQGGGAAVTPVAASLRTFTDRLAVLGVAKGRQSVTLSSNTAELVTGVRFHDGQAVSKGQVLVELKAREQDAGVAQAQAAVDLAQTTYDRWKKLFDEGWASKASLDQYKAALVQAQATLAQARSRQADRAIRAPFAGVVGLSDIAPGALINPGTPIVSLDDVAVIRVDFDIPDRFIATLKPGQDLTATTDAYPNQQFHGAVAQLDTRVNEQTRALRARAEFPNPGGRLRPGMLIKVAIDQGVRQALAVPEAAVQFSSDQAFVYVIANVNGRSIAQQRTVLAGVDEGGFIEIKDGLRSGELVVGDGMNRVQPNQPVKLLRAPEPLAAPAAQPRAAR
ncbi:MAG TPA: efflux RND transporter periplasmic adaptor subunit [Caulobacteraceae bacterium]